MTILGPGDVAVACARVSARPGRTATGVNHIAVYGAKGPQTLNLLDPIPVPDDLNPVLVDLGINLATALLTHPNDSGQVELDPSWGGC